ncbi:MAG: hypothetical protein H7836_04600 [Magnetococcus sp. YQC-3]
MSKEKKLTYLPDSNLLLVIDFNDWNKNMFFLNRKPTSELSHEGEDYFYNCDHTLACSIFPCKTAQKEKFTCTSFSDYLSNNKVSRIDLNIIEEVMINNL